MMDNWLKPKVCPVCGKEFYPVQLHSYRDRRDRTKLVCTYKCLRESERIHKANRKKPGRKPKAKAVES